MLSSRLERKPHIGLLDYSRVRRCLAPFHEVGTQLIAHVRAIQARDIGNFFVRVDALEVLRGKTCVSTIKTEFGRQVHDNSKQDALSKNRTATSEFAMSCLAFSGDTAMIAMTAEPFATATLHEPALPEVQLPCISSERKNKTLLR